MKYLIILLVMAAGGISGYFIGAHQGKAAIEALASLEQAAKQEKAESDKAINALKESMAGLTAEHKNELIKIETRYKQQRAKLDDALAGKDKKIKDMTAKMNNNQQEIESLRNNAVSATDPVEKKKLLEKVAQLEIEKRNLESGVEGLKCLSVAAPDEILVQLQGK
jgi:flagellar basal body-associated protein FliL